MKRMGAIIAMMWLAALSSAAAASPGGSAPGQTVDVPSVQETTQVHWGYPVVRIGEDYTLKAADAAREVTVIFGDATIEGRVDRDVVIVLGSARLAGTAVVGGSLVVVGGSARIADGARVNEDLFVGGGGLEAAAGFTPGGHSVIIGSARLGGKFEALVPWLTRGLLWGRPIVPELPWVWVVVGLFFLVYLALNIVFDRPIRACATTLAERPLTAFLVGLLVLLLAGPVCLLLAVSVIGIAVVPFVICALFVAALLGRIGVARWIGMSVVAETEGNRRQGVRSFAIGAAIVTLAYIVPVLGFVTWTLVGIIGLGAASLAFMRAYRRENPAPPRPVAPAVAAAPAPAAAVAHEAPHGEAASPLAPPEYAAVANNSLVALPRAGFLERLAAFALDVILVSIAMAMFTDLFESRHGPNPFFLLLLAYHIGFWTWKGTTVGGIICQLRLVRIDGAPLRFGDALVRGLASIFSLAVLGLGALWILKDPERQAWHDKIAGTFVVKVPRNWPL